MFCARFHVLLLLSVQIGSLLVESGDKSCLLSEDTGDVEAQLQPFIASVQNRRPYPSEANPTSNQGSLSSLRVPSRTSPFDADRIPGMCPGEGGR